MKFEILLRIPTTSEEVCKSVLEALEPDNISAPKGITIKTHCKDSELIINIRSLNVGTLTVRNTVDDILVHVGLALKSISSINERETAIKTFKLPQ